MGGGRLRRRGRRSRPRLSRKVFRQRSPSRRPPAPGRSTQQCAVAGTPTPSPPSRADCRRCIWGICVSSGQASHVAPGRVCAPRNHRTGCFDHRRGTSDGLTSVQRLRTGCSRPASLRRGVGSATSALRSLPEGVDPSCRYAGSATPTSQPAQNRLMPASSIDRASTTTLTSCSTPCVWSRSCAEGRTVPIHCVHARLAHHLAPKSRSTDELELMRLRAVDLDFGLWAGATCWFAQLSCGIRSALSAGGRDLVGMAVSARWCCATVQAMPVPRATG